LLRSRWAMPGSPTTARAAARRRRSTSGPPSAPSGASPDQRMGGGAHVRHQARPSWSGPGEHQTAWTGFCLHMTHCRSGPRPCVARRPPGQCSPARVRAMWLAAVKLRASLMSLKAAPLRSSHRFRWEHDEIHHRRSVQLYKAPPGFREVGSASHCTTCLPSAWNAPKAPAAAAVAVRCMASRSRPRSTSIAPPVQDSPQAAAAAPVASARV